MKVRFTTWLLSLGLASSILAVAGAATLAQLDPAMLAGTVDPLTSYLQWIGTSPLGFDPSLLGVGTSPQGVGTSPS